MALNFGNQSAQERGEFERRPFTQANPSPGIATIMQGFAITRAFLFTSGVLEIERENIGTQVNFSLGNFTGASRNITIIVTNETQGTTLSSGVIDLDDQFGSVSRFYSLEKVAEGDTIRVAFGNEGVGTAVDSSTAGFLFAELVAVFIAEDEST